MVVNTSGSDVAAAIKTTPTHKRPKPVNSAIRSPWRESLVPTRTMAAAVTAKTNPGMIMMISPDGVRVERHTSQSGMFYPARHEGPITRRRAAEGLPLISKKEEVSDRDRNCLEQDKPAQESPMGACTALHHSHARHHRRL